MQVEKRWPHGRRLMCIDADQSTVATRPSWFKPRRWQCSKHKSKTFVSSWRRSARWTQTSSRSQTPSWRLKYQLSQQIRATNNEIRKSWCPRKLWLNLAAHGKQLDLVLKIFGNLQILQHRRYKATEASGHRFQVVKRASFRLQRFQNLLRISCTISRVKDMRTRPGLFYDRFVIWSMKTRLFLNRWRRL